MALNWVQSRGWLAKSAPSVVAAILVLLPATAHAAPSPWIGYQTLAEAPSEGAVGDNFGNSVALGDGLAAVGACDADSSLGKVFLYSRTGASWNEQPPLAPEGLSQGARFGWSLSISGDLLAVGAPYDAGVGSAFVFEREDAGGFKGVQLPYATGDAGDAFGFSIAAYEDTIVVGAPEDNTLDAGAGAAYVFIRNGAGWKQLGPALLAADSATPGSRVSHAFGEAVSIWKDVIVVAAWGEAAAYVFERSGQDWVRTKRLVQSDPQAYDDFAITASVRDDVIAVAASNHDDAEHGEDSGTVYVYRRVAGVWPEQESERVNGDSAIDGGAFGFRLSLSAGGMVVGASAGDPGNRVYFFRDAGGFKGFDALTPEDLAIGDIFGRDVATFGQGVLVGTPNWYDALGSARLFGLPNGSNCGATIDCVQGVCSEGVCCDRPCDGECESCLGARKVSGENGVCGFVVAGTDPRAFCPTAICRDEHTEIPAQKCNEAGACVAQARDCGAYTCSDGACRTECESSADCDESSGFECLVGTCLVPLGGPCADDSACRSGYCSVADGVCCDKPCVGKCESCLAAKKGAGRDGVCSPLPDGADPDDECEADESNMCGATGSCDGKGQCRSFAPPTLSCGVSACSPSGVATGPHCSGDGDCSVGEVDCGLYLCRNGECQHTCQSNEDCASGAFCGGKHCQRLLDDGADCGDDGECGSQHCVGGACSTVARCSDDGTTLLPLTGKSKDCAPYTCSGGECLTICADTSDCAPHVSCNPTNHQCEVEKPKARSVSSCSASSRSALGLRPSPWLVLGLVGQILCLARRGRRRPH